MLRTDAGTVFIRPDFVLVYKKPPAPMFVYNQANPVIGVGQPFMDIFDLGSG